MVFSHMILFKAPQPSPFSGFLDSLGRCDGILTFHTQSTPIIQMYSTSSEN